MSRRPSVSAAARDRGRALPIGAASGRAARALAPCRARETGGADRRLMSAAAAAAPDRAPLSVDAGGRRSAAAAPAPDGLQAGSPSERSGIVDATQGTSLSLSLGCGAAWQTATRKPLPFLCQIVHWQVLSFDERAAAPPPVILSPAGKARGEGGPSDCGTLRRGRGTGRLRLGCQ